MSINPASDGSVPWRTSRICESAGCVRVARQGEFVLVGSTRDPDSLVVRFTHEEWSEFLAGAKLGDFDDL
jgi:hypothetical protein